jgi:DNA-binding NarL/FixJ family response regulator
MINAAAAAKPVAAPCIRVALVEDDRQVREGLVVLIGNSPGLACVSACVSAENALQRLPALDPDVVLMDIQLPGMSGIECILRLKQLCPGAQIMMLTVFEDHDRIYQSLKAGASGYLLKQTPPAELLAAITELHRGGSPMSSQIARRVVEAFQHPVHTDIGDHQLSPREQEIVSLLAQGHLYKEIADQLGRSVETVRTHIRNIYEKLHVRSRTEAVNKIYGGGKTVVT